MIQIVRVLNYRSMRLEFDSSPGRSFFFSFIIRVTHIISALLYSIIEGVENFHIGSCLLNVPWKWWHISIMDAHRRWNFLNGKKRNESTPILYHLFMHFCIFALESPIMSASRLAYVCVCLSTWQLQLHKTITNVRDKVNYTSLSNLEKTYGHLKSSKLSTFVFIYYR